MALVYRSRSVIIQEHFGRFLDNIELDSGRVGRIRSAAQRLAEFCHSDLGISQYAPHVFFQGSIANNTAVKPLYARREYDVDMLVLMSLRSSSPADVLNWFTKRLRQDADYRPRIRPPKDKCVRLNYAGDFHVDIVPAHRVTSNDADIQIPSRRSGWLSSHPKGYSAWCRQQEQRTGGHFTRCVKMMKRWRDRTGSTRDAVSSILLTTLLGGHIPTPALAVSDAVVVLQTLVSLDQYLQLSPRKPAILNPAMQSEDLAAGWAQSAYSSFRRQIRLATQMAMRAHNASSNYQAVRLWRRLFGNAFPLTA